MRKTHSTSTIEENSNGTTNAMEVSESEAKPLGDIIYKLAALSKTLGEMSFQLLERINTEEYPEEADLTKQVHYLAEVIQDTICEREEDLVEAVCVHDELKGDKDTDDLFFLCDFSKPKDKIKLITNGCNWKGV